MRFKPPLNTLLFALAVGWTALTCHAELVKFDKAKPGAPPSGWSLAMTHSGGAPRWEVVRDSTSKSKDKVLAQLSTDATRGRYPLAIYDNSSLKDGVISVRFKTISGTVDQAAGIVWRYQDPDNYYIGRANALEDNVVLYKLVKGERRTIAPKGTPPDTYGVKVPVPKQTWSELGVIIQGNTFKVLLDGKQIFEVEDSTFSSAGKAGLWTKADSVTQFNQFRFEGQ